MLPTFARLGWPCFILNHRLNLPCPSRFTASLNILCLHKARTVPKDVGLGALERRSINSVIPMPPCALENHANRYKRRGYEISYRHNYEQWDKIYRNRGAMKKQTHVHHFSSDILIASGQCVLMM